jgi:hypothetical protein
VIKVSLTEVDNISGRKLSAIGLQKLISTGTPVAEKVAGMPLPRPTGNDSSPRYPVEFVKGEFTARQSDTYRAFLVVDLRGGVRRSDAPDNHERKRAKSGRQVDEISQTNSGHESSGMFQDLKVCVLLNNVKLTMR